MVLPELARVLRPGGVLQLMFKNGNGILTLFDKDYGVERNFQLYDENDLLQVLQRHGMRIIEAECACFILLKCCMNFTMSRIYELSRQRPGRHSIDRLPLMPQHSGHSSTMPAGNRRRSISAITRMQMPGQRRNAAREHAQRFTRCNRNRRAIRGEWWNASEVSKQRAPRI